MFVFADASVNKIFRSALYTYIQSFLLLFLSNGATESAPTSFSSSLRPPRRRLLSQHKYRQPIRVNFLGLQILITSPLVPIPLSFKLGYKTLSYWKLPAKILVLIEGPNIIGTYIKRVALFRKALEEKGSCQI
jgi:hypothetical protein